MKKERLDKEALQEKYEDSLFAVLMDEFSEIEGLTRTGFDGHHKHQVK